MVAVSLKKLETGGGIFNALPLLGDAPFVVVNADIWTDFPFSELPGEPDGLAHLVLVDNPQHNAGGDFGIEDGLLVNRAPVMYTFSGIGLYSPALFDGIANGKSPLAPILRELRERIEPEVFRPFPRHLRWHFLRTGFIVDAGTGIGGYRRIRHPPGERRQYFRPVDYLLRLVLLQFRFSLL